VDCRELNKRQIALWRLNHSTVFALPSAITVKEEQKKILGEKNSGFQDFLIIICKFFFCYFQLQCYIFGNQAELINLQGTICPAHVHNVTVQKVCKQSQGRYFAVNALTWRLPVQGKFACAIRRDAVVCNALSSVKTPPFKIVSIVESFISVHSQFKVDAAHFAWSGWNFETKNCFFYGNRMLFFTLRTNWKKNPRVSGQRPSYKFLLHEILLKALQTWNLFCYLP